MGTSDIALERVRALLKIDTGSGSLHEHLVRIVRKLVADQPEDALLQIEALSRHLKQSTFRGVPAPDKALTIVPDAIAEGKRQQWCADILDLIRMPPIETAPPRILGAVQNFLEDAAMFEWAGVGFGQQESLYIAMSLKKLSMESPALERLRFWGKILGTQGDYYVAEGVMRPVGVAPASPALPGTPEFDVEPQGEGVNSFVYWVSSSPNAPWVRLPGARASHIVAARSIKRLMTGNLDDPVLSIPWFPGKERNFLRAQIARITATCTLAVKGWYELDEEAGENKIREAEEPSFPGQDELAEQAAWCHCAPYINKNGKCDWPDMDALADKLSEDVIAELNTEKEAEPEHSSLLDSVEADNQELKGDDDVGSPAWSIKVCGDKGLYTFADDKKSYSVAAIRSRIWPGAVCVAQGSQFRNIYVGYGMKSGQLVPPDPKTGLPLEGTSAFSPLVPADIMDEPKDLVEHDEPNPEEDDAADSDKGSVDAEEG